MTFEIKASSKLFSRIIGYYFLRDSVAVQISSRLTSMVLILLCKNSSTHFEVYTKAEVTVYKSWQPEIKSLFGIPDSQHYYYHILFSGRILTP